MIIRKLILLLISALAIGCTPLVPKQQNPSEVLSSPMPSKYTTLQFDNDKHVDASQSSIPVQNPWWENFENQDLNHLEKTALSHNFDILTAWARLKQSEAVAKKSLSNRLPSLNLASSHGRSYTASQINSKTPQTFSDANSYELGLAASYELDLWGRLASAHNAEELRLQASTEDLHAITITTSASTAEAWAKLLGNRKAIKILKQQIDVNKKLCAMQETRFSNGLAERLDVFTTTCEAHFIFSGQIVRGDMFYANPSLKKAQLRVPQLLQLGQEVTHDS